MISATKKRRRWLWEVLVLSIDFFLLLYYKALVLNLEMNKNSLGLICACFVLRRMSYLFLLVWRIFLVVSILLCRNLLTFVAEVITK